MTGVDGLCGMVAVVPRGNVFFFDGGVSFGEVPGVVFGVLRAPVI